MAEPVGDLVVDLSLDAARFDEQMARVRRHFSGTESDAKKTAAVVEQSLSRQALAAQKAGISVGQYKAAMRIGYCCKRRCTRTYCRYWCAYALGCDWFTWTHHHR
ncbi:hypothetical protein VEE42_06060 [Escherichia coli]|nr:hypothetical protein VEE42_06060 [Escherichia coli]